MKDSELSRSRLESRGQNIVFAESCKRTMFELGSGSQIRLCEPY